MINEMAKCLSKTDETHLGIMICGSGIGMSIIANRHPKVRAALCFNEEYATLSRMHNDANVICLGARFLTKENAIKIVEKFVNTQFEAGRHCERIDILSNPKFN
jgi:ribose 5-phosphate isomerase B